MKNYESLGKELSKAQAQNVNGGVSVICSTNNGAATCRVTCKNGYYIVIRGCMNVTAISNCGREVVIACGTLYRCG